MKKQVFYIHGGAAYSDYKNFLEDLKTKPIWDLPSDELETKKWTQTLREDLGDSYEVFMPTMPNKQNAKYEEWKIWFERHFEYLRDDLILLGWSQGGYFLVKYLIENEIPFTIKALLLAAAPFETDDFEGEDGGDFAFDTNRVSELQNKIENIVILSSKDDFVVPYEHSVKYAKALPQAEFITFEDRNHFLIEEFPELIKKIKSFG